ncbi:hypothetical protein SK128_026953 [Halocaridina rubra]|uniref:Uncharacterized protein n=1 Tax=Halocaridina rubra TaxID=373956 RepID=A0AAN8X2K0_HALRR
MAESEAIAKALVYSYLSQADQKLAKLVVKKLGQTSFLIFFRKFDVFRKPLFLEHAQWA